MNSPMVPSVLSFTTSGTEPHGSRSWMRSVEPSMPPIKPHIQCWTKFVSAYKFRLSYLRGRDNANPEFLSRLPLSLRGCAPRFSHARRIRSQTTILVGNALSRPNYRMTNYVGLALTASVLVRLRLHDPTRASFLAPPDAGLFPPSVGPWLPVPHMQWYRNSTSTL